jgi:hypothetical protein
MNTYMCLTSYITWFNIGFILNIVFCIREIGELKLHRTSNPPSLSFGRIGCMGLGKNSLIRFNM